MAEVGLLHNSHIDAPKQEAPLGTRALRHTLCFAVDTGRGVSETGSSLSCLL